MFRLFRIILKNRQQILMYLVLAVCLVVQWDTIKIHCMECLITQGITVHQANQQQEAVLYGQLTMLVSGGQRRRRNLTREEDERAEL